MSSSSSLNPQDESAQRELQQFLQLEQQKQKFQQQVHHFTDLCWDKCIASASSSGGFFSSSGGSGKLDRSETNCVGNCVERFLDCGTVLVRRLESMSSSSADGF